MKHKNILMMTVLAWAGAQPGGACDMCSVYTAQPAQDGGKGIFTGLAAQFSNFGTLQLDSQKIPGNGEYIHSLITQVFAGYSFNQSVTVQMNLPFIHREFGSDAMHGSETGIGDLSLIGNVRLYHKTTENFSFTWTALGGIKVPTGDSSQLNTPDSALPDGVGGHDLALGSGSVDGIVGTGFSARWKRIFLEGQMQYAIRTEGDFQHQYDNDWTWSGGPGVYLALKDDYTIALQAAVSGESKGLDTFAGVPDEDSAATLVYVGPRLSFTWSKHLSGHVGAELPVSIENSGEQVVVDYRLNTAVTWRF